MAEDQNEQMGEQRDSGVTTWGPKLFLWTVVAVLLFFYWLLIYSGGVTVHHT
ncbi:MAG: hypothetical protein GY753_13990 [Gammaproteobacteria bacterium]|nr:hypothetical protein [Gammaproteobacteria bacterium]